MPIGNCHTRNHHGQEANQIEKTSAIESTDSQPNL